MRWFCKEPDRFLFVYLETSSLDTAFILFVRDIYFLFVIVILFKIYEPSRWAARSNLIQNITILSLLYFSDIILGCYRKIKLGNGPLQPVTVNNSTGTVS